MALLQTTSGFVDESTAEPPWLGNARPVQVNFATHSGG